jgi:hypothetical protein
MNDTTDYEPVFQHVPDDWRERWRLLRRFTERWFRLSMPEPGWHADVQWMADEIEKTEQKLKVQLPPSVREWMAFGWDLLAQSGSDILNGCNEIKDLKAPAAISLLIEDSGGADFYAAVRKENLTASDPAVHGYLREWGAADFVDCGLYTPHVTSFVFRHLMRPWRGDAGGFRAGVRVTDELLEQLADAFPVRSKFDEIQVFERMNLIALLDSHPYLKGETHLIVKAWKPLQTQEVPAFLREYARSALWPYVIFSSR